MPPAQQQATCQLVLAAVSCSGVSGAGVHAGNQGGLQSQGLAGAQSLGLRATFSIVTQAMPHKMTAAHMDLQANAPWNKCGRVSLTKWLAAKQSDLDVKRLACVGNIVIPRCAQLALHVLAHQGEAQM